MEPGELVSLLGPSGCGKTTALRIAAGFECADSRRRSRVDGSDISRTPAHKRNMGMVFQSYSLFPNLTSSANVAFGLRIAQRVERATQARGWARCSSWCSSSQLANRYPHQLSGGQQQRVALARALAVRAGGAAARRAARRRSTPRCASTLRDEIRRIQTELGITTLFVTHDQEEALAISDRIGVMSHGRLEQLGTPTRGLPRARPPRSSPASSAR